MTNYGPCYTGFPITKKARLFLSIHAFRRPVYLISRITGARRRPGCYVRHFKIRFAQGDQDEDIGYVFRETASGAPGAAHILCATLSRRRLSVALLQPSAQAALRRRIERQAREYAGSAGRLFEGAVHLRNEIDTQQALKRHRWSPATTRFRIVSFNQRQLLRPRYGHVHLCQVLLSSCSLFLLLAV